MAITVVRCAAYRTNVEPKWNQDEWNAYKLIKAIKREDFKGYADVVVDGRLRRITKDSPDGALDWFASRASEWVPSGRLSIVPVPNKIAVRNNPFTFPTAMLANQVARRIGGGASADDVLRWVKHVPAAHKGGSRNAEDLCANLVIVGQPRNALCVLVDDMYTTGAHIRSCAAKLQRAGVTICAAIAAGRATERQEDSPLQADSIEI